METEVKKANKGLVFLVTIIIIIILCACFYRIYDRVMKIDTNPTTKKKAEIKVEEEGFLYHNIIDYSLNNATHKIRYKYYYHRCRDMECEEGNQYYISVTTFINDQKIENSETNIYYGKEKFLEPKDVTMDVKNLFKLNKDPLMTIKGSDKDYLVLNLPYNYERGQISKPIIVNEKGTNIYVVDIREWPSINYKDNEINKLYKNQFYIDQEKIYYLNYENCQAYKYTIAVFNDKVDQKKEVVPANLVNITGEEC